MKQRMVLIALCLLSVTVPVWGAQQSSMRAFEKNGKKYIEKSYVLKKYDAISDVADSTFSLDGYSYSQIDIESKDIMQIQTKDVEEWKTASVSAQGTDEIYEKIGETIAYTDKEGFKGELKPELADVNYYVSGYVNQTKTKNGSQMFYNLSSMDTSQIPKSIWRDGVKLHLMDVHWIGDNRSASADTAVGNQFAAKGIYQGTYQVNVPSGYTVEVLYKGTAEKEVLEQVSYTVTYVGEKMKTGLLNKLPVPFIIAFLLLDAAVIVGAVLLFRKLRKDRQEAELIDVTEDEEAGDSDED